MSANEGVSGTASFAVWRDRSAGYVAAFLFLVAGAALIGTSITSAALYAAAGVVVCAIVLAVRDQIRRRRSSSRL